MLHILLLILKILGIILASVLGLILLILAIVLFVPVRYSFFAEYYEGKPHIKVKVNWLFHIINAFAEYKEELVYKVRITAFTIFPKPPKKEKKKKTKSRREKEPENIFDLTDAKTTDDTIGDNLITENGSDDEDAVEYDTIDSDSSERDSSDGKKSFSLKEIILNLVQKIIDIYDKVKNAVVGFVNKVKNMACTTKEKIEFVVNTINDSSNKALVSFLFKQLKALIKAIKPRKFKAYVHYGLDSPDSTAAVAMYIAPIYGLLGLNIEICPDFEKKIIEGEVFFKGHIRIISLVIIVLKVYFNKDFQEKILKK